MRTLASKVRSLALWSLWVALLIVWVATLWVLARDGHLSYVLLAAVVIALLGVLYYAEGLELAATDLLDKEPDQLSNEGSRVVLRDIQARPGFFYAHRQVFVVTIIAFTSLTTSYPWLYIPFVGRTGTYDLPFWFSLVFTTLTVLWFCQVTPKRLAVINSDKFLVGSRFVWRLIKLVSVLGLPNPTDFLVAIAVKRFDYGRSRQLSPSRQFYYSLSSLLLGSATFATSTVITLGASGAASIERKFLLIMTHGEFGAIDGSLDTQSEFLVFPHLDVLGVYVAPVPENLNTYHADLKALFDTDAPPPGSGLGANRLPEWAHNVEVHREEQLSCERASWSIEGEHLPERFWPSKSIDAAVGRPFAALLYRVRAEVGPDSFPHEQDNASWTEVIDQPCAICTIEIRAEPESNLAVVPTNVSVGLSASGIASPNESAKYRVQTIASRGRLTVDFPLPGSFYTLSWRTLADRETDHHVDQSRPSLVAAGVGASSRGVEQRSAV